MVGQQFLYLTFAALIALPAGLSVQTAGQGCSIGQVRTGICASTSDDSIDIVGSATTAGTPPGSTGSGSAGGSGSGGSPSGQATPPPILKCFSNEVCRAPAQATTTPGTPPVTLRDLASFRPVAGSQHMEPDGWMVVGLDANFYLDSGQHLVVGTLLGQPASVRFTPVAFRWDYGDGTVATRTTGGGPWAALGLREFDPTPTSHVYRTAGTYTVRLSVSYAAEFQVGGSALTSVAGRLTVPVNDLVVSVGDATTVLVAEDCGARPDGPGC